MVLIFIECVAGWYVSCVHALLLVGVVWWCLWLWFELGVLCIDLLSEGMWGLRCSVKCYKIFKTLEGANPFVKKDYFENKLCTW